jgi:hypothetical protein
MWWGINEKFNTLLCKTQPLSTKCVVRHIYPSVVKEVHESDVKQIFPGQTFNIDLTICFSLRYILCKSTLAVFLQICVTSLRKYCIVSSKPSYSTYQKGKSCLITEATNNSLYHVAQNLEALTDILPPFPDMSIFPTLRVSLLEQVFMCHLKFPIPYASGAKYVAPHNLHFARCLSSL